MSRKEGLGMMGKTRTGWLTVIGAAILLTACSDAEPRRAEAGDAGPAEAVTPVAVELFTSQGCSSCPPADALIAELASEPGLVVITRPVTYWDRLGWRDTLGREENTALQRAYAARVEGESGRAFTPQAVVDGRVGLIGSRRRELESAIDDARERHSTVRLAIGRSEGSALTVNLAGETDRPTIVSLVALDASETVPIGSGENGGRTITYANVVRDERVIGSWSGGSLSLPVGELNVPNADRYAVIVRAGDAGPILAAQYI